MGKSPTHASSIGLIHNLSTGYVSSQYHRVYDNDFQTVTRGHEDNEAAVSHIWESLTSENVLEQAHAEHHNLPRLHEDWLDTREIATPKDNDINVEVMRRINQKQGNRDASI